MNNFFGNHQSKELVITLKLDLFAQLLADASSGDCKNRQNPSMFNPTISIAVTSKLIMQLKIL